MNYIPRSEWATSSPSWTPMAGRQHDIFLHHVGGPCPASLPSLAWLEQFEQMAIAAGRARGDHYIALEYHRGVFADGTIYEGRPDGVQGGATLGHNTDSYSICLMGDYRTDQVTEAQIDAVRWQIAQWEQGGEVTASPGLLPHSAVFPTACPGDNARAQIPNMLAAPAPSTGDDFDMPADPAVIRLLTNISNKLNALVGDEEDFSHGSGLATINAHVSTLSDQVARLIKKLDA